MKGSELGWIPKEVHYALSLGFWEGVDVSKIVTTMHGKPLMFGVSAYNYDALCP